MLSRALQIIMLYFLCLFCISCVAEQDASDDLLKIKNFVERVLEAWKRLDWEGMYSCLSEKDREKTSLSEFKKKRVSLANSRKLKNYIIKEISRVDDENYSVIVTLIFSENYNARYQFDSKEKISEYEINWKILGVGDNLYLAFDKRPH